MSRGGARGAQVDAVPLVFSQLSIKASSIESLAATYELEPEVVERTLETAQREGFVRSDGEIYRLTRSGEQATMTRGGDRVEA